MKELLSLFESLLAFGEAGGWKMILMWIIGGTLIYLAIKRIKRNTGKTKWSCPFFMYQFICSMPRQVREHRQR